MLISRRLFTVAALGLLSGAPLATLLAAPQPPVVVLGGNAEAGQPTFTAAPRFGQSRANTGVTIHQIDDTRLLDAVKDVGFSFIRTDLWWNGVQAADGWHWQGFDKLMSNLTARDLGALFILGYQHHMYSPDQPPTLPGQLIAFQSYVYQAAFRYRNKPVRFEVWNEMDDAKYWFAPPSPTNYRRLLETAVKSARSANPDVMIGTGGVQQFDWKFIHAVGDMSASGEKGAPRIGPDAVSVHPYRQQEPETVLADYRDLREKLRSYAKRPEIWATEWAYPSVGYDYVKDINDGHSPEARARQARFATRLFLMSWISQVGLTAYYDMRDDGQDPHDMEHNFGLLDADNQPLPAYLAVRHLFRFTAGGNSARYSMDTNQRYVVLKLNAVGAEKYVVWCYGQGNAINVDLSQLPRSAQIADLYGKPFEKRPTVAVTEAQGPIFITVPM